jgi:two-component system OmpR family response regulator/two-component system response regulator CpxR
MTKMVLWLDGDLELVTSLSAHLNQNGFAVTPMVDGEAGVALVQSGAVDIVVLDLLLPDHSGIDVLRQIRTFSSVPVLILTTLATDMDRVQGLELGADDYVCKPCSPREIAARLRAILKRVPHPTMLSSAEQWEESPTEHSSILRVGRLVLKPAEREVELDGQVVPLTSTEFNLLEILVRHAGVTVSREALSEQALGRPPLPFDRIIDVHVSSLRRKLGCLADDRSCIKTVIGKGYQFIAVQ